MSIWRQLTRGVRVLARQPAADRDLADEVEHYLEEATASLVAGGKPPDEARRAARLEVGNAAVIREQVRGAGWEHLVSTVVSDLAYAARQLRRNLGFAAAAILILGLGIGATTAIFSAADPILFEPLPYPQPGRIAMIWDVFQGARSEITFHTFREVAERSHSFDAIAVMEPWQPTMTGPAEPERFAGQRVSARYFRALGVSSAIGRDFRLSDDQFHGPRVVILGDSVWRRRFARDPRIVGREVTLDGNLYTVIGVMPPAFENVLAPASEMWTPLQYGAANASTFDTPEWGHHLRMVARLAPGVPVEQARREIDAIARTRIREFPRPPWAALRNGFILSPLKSEVTAGIRPALVAVLGAVALLLVIACVNVTNLLLARGARRRSEFAMRMALGAGRWRLTRQVLTESLLLSFLGGTVGMVLAETGVRALVAVSPAELPRVAAIGVNGPVFAFALALTTAIGLLVGLIPALHASRGRRDSGMQGRLATGHQMVRRTLVVAEIAFALVLLVSAGLLFRSLDRVFAETPGFDPANVLTMQVQTSGNKFRDDDSRRRFFAQALESVRRVPGVAAAAFTSQLPLGDADLSGLYGTRFEDGKGWEAFRYVVTPGYVEAMRIPLRRGRLLDEHDSGDAPPVVLISEDLAKSQFGDRNPLGQRVHVGPLNRPWFTVVGVVGDVKQSSLGPGNTAAAYLTPAQSWFADDAMSLVVRANGRAAALAPELRRAIWSVDKDQPIVRVATMEQLLAASEAKRRFALIVFEMFALVGLVLAATGIYGVLSGGVTERVREIGVRAALGATRREIVALVLRQAMALTGVGVLIGLGGAAVATRALASLLFGVSRLDPPTYVGVIALVACVSAIACAIPAWRASRVDPSVALRGE